MKISAIRLTFTALVGGIAIAACGEQEAKLPAKAGVPTEQIPAEQTPEQKFSATLNAANQGNAEAQFNLGELYWRGEGVEKDLSKVLEWNLKSAEQGYTKAQLVVGLIYMGGIGVPVDKAKGIQWIRKAAEIGEAEAQFNLGELYWRGEGVEKDLSKAVEWFRKAAERGSPAAQFNLGWMYANGLEVEKDLAKAVDWYRKASEQGNPGAQFNLGWMYATGQGVVKNLANAVEWWRKAAEQGDEDAQSNLGLMYANGSGVEKDEVLAYAWLNIAATNGNRGTVTSRDNLERNMTRQQLQEAQQLSSQWKKGQSIVRASANQSDTAARSGTSGVLKRRGTGTVFVVSKAGHAVTNQHVVEGCTELRIEGRDGVAKLVTEDKINDLALLQMPGHVAATAPIAKDPHKVRQGEEIIVFGFPLNFVLSSGGNLTPGVISALTGLGNNTNQLQITAPIQPGSSGSPLLNKKGEVVGAVVMKLSDKEMAKVTGSIGQNVNFAVSGQTLKTFLDTHKVDYRTTGLMSFDKSTADIADEARKWTTVVECWR